MIKVMMRKYEHVYYRTETPPIPGEMGPFIARNVGGSLTVDPRKTPVFREIESSLPKNFCGSA